MSALFPLDHTSHPSTSLRTLTAGILCMLLGAAGLPLGCTAEDTNPANPAEMPDREPFSGPLAKQLNDVFSTAYAKEEGLTAEQQLERRRLAYAQGPGVDVATAENYDDFVSAMSLSEPAQSILAEKGFVAVPVENGPADVLYEVFSKDLPVFVSADAILHAWHRSFDAILQFSEEKVAALELKQLLAKTVGALDPNADAQRDALFYLGVAQKLLDPEAKVPPKVADEVSAMLDNIATRQILEVPFLGEVTIIDFSQFIPRGHSSVISEGTRRKYK
ncbi:MAG: DUF3160 domain-containing protein [Myxococcota bacterium]|nr:DUF3160 domain-containing protein [Myxococcota bacterium]